MWKFILYSIWINCIFMSMASAVDGQASVKVGSKLSANECQFQHTNTYTGIVEEVVIHRCDFVQTKSDMEKTHVAIIKENSPLAPGKCVFDEVNTYTGIVKKRLIKNCTQDNNTCEEITESYVICHGNRYELVKNSNSSLKRDMKKIEDTIDLDAIKSKTGAVPK